MKSNFKAACSFFTILKFIEQTSRYHEIPLLNTTLNFKTPCPPISIMGANRRIECLVIHSFGIGFYSPLQRDTSGYIIHILYPYHYKRHGYQNHISSCRFGFLIVHATSISSLIRRYCLIAGVKNGSVPIIYGS